MQEYWVNVYPGYLMGDKLPTQLIAAQRDGGASIYRIHVKMDGGYNKRKIKPIKKPVRWDINYLEKGDWMC